MLVTWYFFQMINFILIVEDNGVRLCRHRFLRHTLSAHPIGKSKVILKGWYGDYVYREVDIFLIYQAWETTREDFLLARSPTSVASTIVIVKWVSFLLGILTQTFIRNKFNLRRLRRRPKPTRRSERWFRGVERWTNEGRICQRHLRSPRFRRYIKKVCEL